MRHAPRDHKIHPGKHGGFRRFLLLRDRHLRQQLLIKLPVLFLGKIIHIGLCDHTAYARDFIQLFLGRVRDPGRVIPKGTADHLGICQSDIRDPQAVDQPGQRRIPCVFNTL